MPPTLVVPRSPRTGSPGPGYPCRIVDAARKTTLLLRRLGAGDATAAEEMLPLLHDELRRIAERAMRGERDDHTLQPTALVNEAFLRLAGENAWESRAHFLRVAARAMRNILVDHARARAAGKRGGGDAHRVTLDDGVGFDDGRSAATVLHVHELLAELAEVDEPLARIVELRFFGGLSEKEIAASLGISTRSVQRGWRTARAWLLARLDDDGGGDAGRGPREEP